MSSLVKGMLRSFRTFDKDQSGFIDFREFLVAMDITTCGTPEEKLQWAFR